MEALFFGIVVFVALGLLALLGALIFNCWLRWTPSGVLWLEDYRHRMRLAHMGIKAFTPR